MHHKLGVLCAKLEDHARAQAPVDVTQMMVMFTLDFIGQSAFNYDLRALEDTHRSEGARLFADVQTVFTEFVLKQGANPIRPWLFWLPEIRAAKQASKRLQALALQVMSRYRATHSEEDIRTGQSILAHILRNPVYPSDEARVHDVLTLIVAGYDTTGFTVSWILYDLSRTPKVMQQLQSELDAAFPDPSVDPSPSELSQRRVLNNCIKESMRLWPVAALGVGRVNSKDVHAQGFIIPKGSQIMTPFYAIHRMPCIPDADAYRPERWDEPDSALTARYMPFSQGRRNCVGQNLANLEIRVVLARLMRRFAFEVVQEPAIDFRGVTMKLRDLLLRVSNRLGGQTKG